MQKKRHEPPARAAVSVAEALAAAGIEPREARWLLAAASGFSEAGVLAHPERELPVPVAERFASMVQRRRAGEPMAYLLGQREFYGIEFIVTPATLIPRPETELLVELALERIAPRAAASLLELGTGCGAVALALKRHRSESRVVAVEASAAALAIARRNATRLALEIELRHGRWFDPVAGERFDLILANPPYVAAADPHLAAGDLRFEPRAALVAGGDGLEALREIVAEAGAHLAAGGWLLLEHGQGQDAAVRALLRAAGLNEIATWPDLAGIARVSGARLKSY